MTTGIVDQFAHAGEQLPGTDDLTAIRRAALDRFSELGLPGRRLETWRYTDLAKLTSQDLKYIAAPPDAATLEAASLALAGLKLDEQAPRCVFIDGHLIDSLSHQVTTDSLSIESLTTDPSRLLNHEAPIHSSLVALNTAFASAGVAVHVSGIVEQPLQLVFIGAGAKLSAQLRLRIELDRDAQAAITQYFVDLPDAGDSWVNLVTDIDQRETSHLSLYRSQQHGCNRVHTALTRATIAEAAKLSVASVELGGRLIRNELEISLDGERAGTDILGLAVTRDQQHCDTRIDVDHRAANTTSRQDYRAIAAGRSKSIFNGKVTVAKDAQHIEARQRNDNLLLAPTAEIDTKPELEIYADQVICSHGATVGELSEEHLFYLRSRGIDVESARGILTAAFADVILARFALEDFRQSMRDAVAGVLPRRIDIEDAQA